MKKEPEAIDFSMFPAPHNNVRQRLLRASGTRLATTVAAAQIEPVRVRHGLEQKNRQGFMSCLLFLLACVRGFEPPTFWSVAKRSIQLS